MPSALFTLSVTARHLLSLNVYVPVTSLKAQAWFLLGPDRESRATLVGFGVNEPWHSLQKATRAGSQVVNFEDPFPERQVDLCRSDLEDGLPRCGVFCTDAEAGRLKSASQRSPALSSCLLFFFGGGEGGDMFPIGQL